MEIDAGTASVSGQFEREKHRHIVVKHAEDEDGRSDAVDGDGAMVDVSRSKGDGLAGNDCGKKPATDRNGLLTFWVSVCLCVDGGLYVCVCIHV